MPQYVTVVLPVPNSRSSRLAAFTIFQGMSLTVADPEMRDLIEEIANVLGDMLPEENIERIKSQIMLTTATHREGLRQVAADMVDNLNHLSPDDPDSGETEDPR